MIQDVARRLDLNENVVLRELAEYRTDSGIWGTKIVNSSLECLTPSLWWKSTCQSTLLSKVANEILNLPCTSAVTERSFSTHGWIHNSNRNCLSTARAGQITYVVHNLRILKPDTLYTVDREKTMPEGIEVEVENDLLQIEVESEREDM